MQFEYETSQAEDTEQPKRNVGGRPLGATKLKADDETLKQINGLARIQCTQREAAAVLGVHRDTFSAFLGTHEKALEAWESGLEQGRASLRRHQYKAAENGNATMQIWLGKQWLDQKDKSLNEVTGADGAPIVPSINVTIKRPE